MRCAWIPVVLAVCAAPAGAQNASATLSGRVAAEAAGHRLPAAHVGVKLREQGSDEVVSVETDDAGRFSVAVKAGTFDIELDCGWGLVPIQTKITSVKVAEGGQKTLPEIVLLFHPQCQPIPAPPTIVMSPTEHAPRVSGIINDHEGSPLPGLRVQLRSYADLEHPASITTSQDGRYEFLSVAPGKYTISTQAPGHHYQGYDVFVDSSFDVSIPAFEMERCETADCIRPVGLCM